MFASTNFQVADATLSFVERDITNVPADAIVIAANARLIGGGRVAIHRAGGSSIMRELDAIRPSIGRCKSGQSRRDGCRRFTGPVCSLRRGARLSGRTTE